MILWSEAGQMIVVIGGAGSLILQREKDTAQITFCVAKQVKEPRTLLEGNNHLDDTTPKVRLAFINADAIDHLIEHLNAIKENTPPEWYLEAQEAVRIQTEGAGE